MNFNNFRLCLLSHSSFDQRKIGPLTCTFSLYFWQPMRQQLVVFALLSLDRHFALGTFSMSFRFRCSWVDEDGITSNTLYSGVTSTFVLSIPHPYVRWKDGKTTSDSVFVCLCSCNQLILGKGTGHAGHGKRISWGAEGG